MNMQDENALHKRIENDHTFHPVQPGQAEKYVTIRDKAKEFGHLLVNLCPQSRELSTALTALDQVVFNANASIARNTPPKKPLEVGDVVRYVNRAGEPMRAFITTVWTQDCVNLHREGTNIPTSVPRYQAGMTGFYFEEL